MQRESSVRGMQRESSFRGISLPAAAAQTDLVEGQAIIGHPKWTYVYTSDRPLLTLVSGLFDSSDRFVLRLVIGLC